MDTPELPRLLKVGLEGDDVKRVQEWLTLWGHPVRITGTFDAATGAAVTQFRNLRKLTAGAEVDAFTLAELMRPMQRATERINPATSLTATVLAIAELQLAQSPLEVGGENRGPWVRLYMSGKDGPGQRWSAGFVSWCLKRAAQAMGVQAPLAPTEKPMVLAADARARRSFVAGPRAATHVRPGHVFLLPEPNNSDAWAHAGIVRAVGLSSFDTIEGNSSSGRPVNGDRVMSRKRAFSACDFIVF